MDYLDTHKIKNITVLRWAKDAILEKCLEMSRNVSKVGGGGCIPNWGPLYSGERGVGHS